MKATLTGWARYWRRGTAFVFVAGCVLAEPALAARNEAPTLSTPLAISYQGSFDLKNTMVPQGTQHSFTYHVEWAYAWKGTWGELFGQTAVSNETSFGSSKISGNLHVLWRNTTNGPDLTCTLRIVPEMGDYPNFSAIYDPSLDTLRVKGLEAPTSRYGRYVGDRDPMCGGGPQIDIFGAPASWNPLGDGGARLPLAGSGVHPYNRTWSWKHSFGHGLSRTYVSSIRSTLTVDFSG